MKLKRNQLRGSTLTVSAVMTGVIGVALVGYLRLISVQQNMLNRAQSWNFAMPIAEAGVEEALSHLHNYAHGSNLIGDGWGISSGNLYFKSNYLGSDNFETTILANGSFAPVTITSRGSVQLPPSANVIQRTIQVIATRNSMFPKGMVAKGQIDFSGNNVMTDSFDSEDPFYSNNGKYDPNKAKDHGDVGTNSGLVNSINDGNANIHGNAATGPGGTVAIGPNGAIGDADWNRFHSGIQPGHVTDDMNVSFPDVTLPYTSGSAPGSGRVNGVNYDYALGAGAYYMSSLSMSGQKNMVVTNKATLVVGGSFSMSGNAKIVITNGGSLKLYVNGSADIGGNGVANYTGNATNFFFYGGTNCTSLKFSGNGEFTGAIYAPNAAFTLGGGGNNSTDFIGASVTSTVKMNGHFNFHYDEALGRYGAQSEFIVTSWREL
jgi:hypothetical protein